VDVDVDTAELRDLKNDAGIADCTEPSAEPADDGLPDLALPCLGGGPEVNLAALRGPLVVNFWASWCGPCRRELPHYQAFSEKYAGSVAVLGIDYNDTQPKAALELARDAGVTYPSLADPATELAEEGLQIPGLPGIAFVDADGRMTRLMFEEIDSLGELEKLVEEHLGVSAP
jgi:thiol-disulfide isomerase/thioredoxin